jgi:DNA-binding beta-propeller fold protein YncE
LNAPDVPANLGWMNTPNAKGRLPTVIGEKITVLAIPVGSGPAGVAVTPDGSKVYVANGDNNVSVIATATKTYGPLIRSTFSRA